MRCRFLRTVDMRLRSPTQKANQCPLYRSPIFAYDLAVARHSEVRSSRTTASGMSPAHGFTIDGTGVTNDSGIAQTLVSGVNANNDGLPITFTQSATVGALITVSNEANPSGSFEWGAYTSFNDQSSAGDGTFYSRGSAVATSFGGVTDFFDQSTAGRATLISDGASVSGGGGGGIGFWGTASADHAIITWAAQ